MSYVLIPATEEQGKTADFFISLYAKCELRDIQIKRVSHPKEKKPQGEPLLPKFIPEEAEKQYSVPPWKLDLVHKMLPYMMTEEDKGIVNIEQSSD